MLGIPMIFRKSVLQQFLQLFAKQICFTNRKQMDTEYGV